VLSHRTLAQCGTGATGHDDWPAGRRRSQEVYSGTFLKQSVRLPGYGIEHEKFIRERKSESGLKKGTAAAGIARPSNRHGQELVAAWMRRLVKISAGSKVTARFRARLG